MKCEDCLFLIDELIETELDEQSAQQINSHLFTCPACAGQYELLQQERKIYSHYWLDAEPSQDLLTEFRANLNTSRKEISKSAARVDRAFNREAKISNFFRLYPSMAMVGCLLILIFAFALLRLAMNETESLNQLETAKFSNKSAQSIESKSTNFNITNERATEVPPSKQIKTLAGNGSILKPVKVKAQTNNGKKSETSGQTPLSAGRSQRLKLKNFATETTQQVEKIELFLRSFRNTEAMQNGETYDISYEKQQARKLLERNLRLKLNAENKRSFYPAELLNKVEPLLIEIANLENTPSIGKVSDIKERLKNQNLIVGLQVY